MDKLLFRNAIRSLTFKHTMSNKATYNLPKLTVPAKPKKNTIALVASGDLRLSANQACWEAQKTMEKGLARPSRRKATRWSAPTIQSARKAWFYQLAKTGDGGIS